MAQEFRFLLAPIRPGFRASLVGARTAQATVLAGSMWWVAATGLTLTVNDTVTMSDLTTIAVAKVAADSVTMSDVATPVLNGGGTAYNLTPSDSVTMSDAFVTSVGKALADAATMSDAVAKNIGQAIADSATMSDGNAKADAKVIADTLTITDLMGFLRTLTLADTISMSDAATPVIDSSTVYNLTAEDTVVISDVVLSNWLSTKTRVRVIDNTMRARVRPTGSRPNAFVDSNSPLGRADNFTVTDEVFFQIGFVRTPADTVTMADALTKTLGRTLADTLTMSDSVVTTYGYNRTLADSVTMSDGISTSFTQGILVTDTVTTSETLVFNVSKALADTVTMTEALTNAFSRTLADTVTMSDAQARAPSKSVADSVTMSDALANAVQRTVVDSVTMSDSATPVNTGEEPETAALAARFTTPPSGPRRGVIDVLIKALKTAGVWSKMDVIVIGAAADSQASLLNWKGAFNDASLPGSAPSFTADRGWIGDNSSQYMRTNFIPSTHGVNFQKDSAYIGYWSRTSASDAGGGTLIGGQGASSNDRVLLHPRSGGATSVAMNNPSTDDVVAADGSGYFAGNRSASNALQAYRNQTQTINVSTASNTLCSVELYVQARNVNGTASDFTAVEIAAYLIGGSLTSTEHNNLETALRAYMVSVGAA